jgi:peptidoglycan/xylan/chitin deacetylase (PgdA/CDA1 family)
MRRASISADIDTLQSIYKGFGLRRPTGYSHAEFEIGLENLAAFLDKFGAKATMFMVGADFDRPTSAETIRQLAIHGHEIANHTQSHAQGLRLMPLPDQETEIAEMERRCVAVTGRRPIGFRSPGWNIGDETAEILVRRGYLYDSSIFPSLLNPLLKALHWASSRSRVAEERSTLGHLRYTWAPTSAYLTASHAIGRSGEGPLVELPITVTPFFRIPFFATFTLATGMTVFRASYRMLRALEMPIQYQFHLSDFVDYTVPEFADQLPATSGAYIPQALRVPLPKKLSLFSRVLESIAKDYDFVTLEELAREERRRLGRASGGKGPT